MTKEQHGFTEPKRITDCITISDSSVLEMRKPDDDVLEKLTPHFKLVESDTDPLPISPKCSKEVFLIVLVVTSPDGYIRRNAIRGTWAESFGKSRHAMKKESKVEKEYGIDSVVKVVFLVGHTPNKQVMDLVNAEAKMFGDIVLGGFHEDYRNLTMKTRLGLKWAYFSCKAKYILKTDDDVFINTFPLVEWLAEQQREKFYSGWCNFDSPVVRDPNNKWFVSTDDYEGTNYPGYCLGGGYVMSDDVLGRMIKMSYGRKLFPMEDLYVGLLIKSLGDVKPFDNKQGFDLVFGGAEGCRYTSLYLAHPVRPDDQLRMLLEAHFALQTC
eukprot:gene13653-4552_t